MKTYLLWVISFICLASAQAHSLHRFFSPITKHTASSYSIDGVWQFSVKDPQGRRFPEFIEFASLPDCGDGIGYFYSIGDKAVIFSIPSLSESEGVHYLTINYMPLPYDLVASGYLQEQSADLYSGEFHDSKNAKFEVTLKKVETPASLSRKDIYASFNLLPGEFEGSYIYRDPNQGLVGGHMISHPKTSEGLLCYSFKSSFGGGSLESMSVNFELGKDTSVSIPVIQGDGQMKDRDIHGTAEAVSPGPVLIRIVDQESKGSVEILKR